MPCEIQEGFGKRYCLSMYDILVLGVLMLLVGAIFKIKVCRGMA